MMRQDGPRMQISSFDWRDHFPSKFIRADCTEQSRVNEKYENALPRLGTNWRGVPGKSGNVKP